MNISNESSGFRIAHLSDTHISPEYNRFNIVKLKNLLSFIVDDRYDHVVITGDVTGHAEWRDYRSIRRLLKYFGLLEYEKLSVTIGNHDIFGGVHRAEDLLSFGKHCRDTNYHQKIELFERTFAETFPVKAFPNESPFPYVKIVGPVALVGMNSIAKFHALRNPVGSNGYVSSAQIGAVTRILRHPSIEELKKIALIHHHFNRYEPYADSISERVYSLFEARTLKLRRRRQVEDVFRENKVDLVLHGHTHIEGIYSRSGITYSSTALNPVRSRIDSHHDVDRLRFNEISILDNGLIETRKHRVAVHSRGSSSKTLDKRFS